MLAEVEREDERVCGDGGDFGVAHAVGSFELEEGEAANGMMTKMGRTNRPKAPLTFLLLPLLLATSTEEAADDTFLLFLRRGGMMMNDDQSDDARWFGGR